MRRWWRALERGTRAHPEMGGAFLFWSCGQLYAVPNTIHGDFLTSFGGSPAAIALGVAVVLLFTLLFAIVLPGALWTAFCVAIAGADEQAPGDGE
jgi:hypothetical protein